MTYEMYRYVFLGTAIGCGVFLVVAIVLFITLRIPKVISDLTGRTARKAIENIRIQNEQSGDRAERVDAQRQKVTGKIGKSSRLTARGSGLFESGRITEQISAQKLPMQESASETTVLYSMDETTVLDTDAQETTVLNAVPSRFEIEYEITYIHSNEVIA